MQYIAGGITAYALLRKLARTFVSTNEALDNGASQPVDPEAKAFDDDIELMYAVMCHVK